MMPNLAATSGPPPGYPERVSAIPGLSQLGTRLLAVPAMRMQPMPLHDRDPDPGLFGPGSVTWRVVREPILVAGGGRALLLQAANPLVAQGAIDHSTYRSDPYGRLLRTLEWVAVCAFGTTREAREICRRVNRLHGPVHGRLPRRHRTPALGPGHVYSARDPQLLRWVHACFVDTMLVAHDAFVGGLAEKERDGFVREWNAVAALMGLPRGGGFETRAELAEYVAAEIDAGRARPGDGSREVARTVLSPPLPSVMAAPAWGLVAFAAVGLLPGRLRRDYGIAWSPLHDAGHTALCAGLRAAHPHLPHRLQVSPAHQWAARRMAAPTERRRRGDRGWRATAA
jgi:uncharacterized protein (DUF2236 family)